MATKIDSRPYKIDVLANPNFDSKAVLIGSGDNPFPDGYLDGATATGYVYELGTRILADAAWTVTVGATAIVMAMPQADVAAIGQGPYTWELVIELATGAKPPVIGGSLTVSYDFAPTVSVPSSSLLIDSTGVTVAIAITTVFADTLTLITGGNAAGTGQDIITGGSA